MSSTSSSEAYGPLEDNSITLQDGEGRFWTRKTHIIQSLYNSEVKIEFVVIFETRWLKESYKRRKDKSMLSSRNYDNWLIVTMRKRDSGALFTARIAKVKSSRNANFTRRPVPGPKDDTNGSGSAGRMWNITIDHISYSAIKQLVSSSKNGLETEDMLHRKQCTAYEQS